MTFFGNISGGDIFVYASFYSLFALLGAKEGFLGSVSQSP